MKNFLTFITSICFSVQIFSQSCSIYGGEVIFEDATINGTVITNPQSPVSINVHYMFPTEDIEQITTQIRQLKILMDSIKRENLSIQQQTKILEQKEANLRKIQQKVDEDRRGIVSESENIKEAKLRFEKEVMLAKKEFEEATSLISSNQTEEPIAQRISELKARGEKIIESTENCLLNDFNVIQIKDIQTGITTFGFSIDDLQNDPNYILIDEYSDGMARVKRNNKFGFYDKEGKLLIEFKYDYAESFVNGFAVVQNLGKWYLINKQDSKVVTFGEKIKNVSTLVLAPNNIYKIYEYGKGEYYINEKEQEIPESDILPYIYSFDKYGLAIVRFPGISGIRFSLQGADTIETRYSYENYGLINTKGEFIVPEKSGYSKIYPFDENGLAKVKFREDLYQIIDTTGKKITIQLFHEIDPFDKNGLAKVESHGVYGIINTKGNFVLPREYSTIFSFDKNGYAKVGKINSWNKNESYGVININGDFVLPCEYDEIYPFDKSGLAQLKKYNSYGIINTNWELVIPCEYSKILPFDKNRYAKVRKTDPLGNYGDYGIINSRGELIIDHKYKLINPFDENGLAVVYSSAHCGVINKNGLEIIPLAFDRIILLSDGFKVKKDKKWYILNTKGECTSRDKDKYNRVIKEFYESN